MRLVQSLLKIKKRFSVAASSSFPRFCALCNVILVLFNVKDFVCFYVQTVFMFQKTKNKQTKQNNITKNSKSANIRFCFFYFRKSFPTLFSVIKSFQNFACIEFRKEQIFTDSRLFNLMILPENHKSKHIQCKIKYVKGNEIILILCTKQ